jgi:hypothetical protein
VKTYLNSAEHFVWAYVDHLSIWTVMGQAAKPIRTETWFMATIACIIIVLVVITAFLVKRSKRKQ